MPRYPLVHEWQFAQAMRDTGYRSTAAAVAELVDNAVQAGARRIIILLREEKEHGQRAITLAVRDDGCGMSRSDLQRALQWGGSSRFGDRSGLGRFGMGLPNSSVSQARRLEVYSWRETHPPLFCYLDLDELAAGELRAVPAPKRVTLPSWAAPPEESGTLVIWRKCDRLDFKKAVTLEQVLARDLGRIFRRMIGSGLSITINGSAVSARDPLFLDARRPWGRAREPVPPLSYEIRAPDGTLSPVVVRFVLLPIARWHRWSAQEKRARGIIGGAGMSVLRAGREIAHGWHFMDGKKRENYDDWWRAELAFEPALDELMGVTHSKQGIRPTQDMIDMLAPDVGAVARRLSGQVRQEFGTVQKKPPARSAAQASARDWRLPRLTAPAARASRRTEAMHVTYGLRFVNTEEADFFAWEINDGELVLALNTNHPFFRCLYHPLEEDGPEWVKKDLEMLLFAYARAEALAQGEAPGLNGALRTRWSDVAAAFLGS